MNWLRVNTAKACQSYIISTSECKMEEHRHLVKEKLLKIHSLTEVCMQLHALHMESHSASALTLPGMLFITTSITRTSAYSLVSSQGHLSLLHHPLWNITLRLQHSIWLLVTCSQNSWRRQILCSCCCQPTDWLILQSYWRLTRLLHCSSYCQVISFWLF